MERLYKRLVTVGMITITAVLAWIYCILEYRDEAVYVIGASLIVVASLYVLLLTYISLRNDKETNLRNYISETIASNLLKMQKSGNDEDVVRLLKAMYVQIRKRNESDTNEIVAASINKAMKVIIKYNQSNNDAMLASIANLTEELESIKSKLETMNTASADVSMTATATADYSPVEDSDFSNITDTNLDMFQQDMPGDTADTVADTVADALPEEPSITEQMPMEETTDSSAFSDMTIGDIPQEQSDNLLAESFFDAFGAEEPTIKEDAVADVIPFPSTQADDFNPEPSTIANPE